MLTIKLVEPNGHEQIYEVERVWSNGDAGGYEVYAVEIGQASPLHFGCIPADHEYGEVFVMNDHGRTIARYTLGGGINPK